VLSGAGLFGTVGTARELGPDAGAAGVAAARLAVAALLLLSMVVVTGEHRQLRWLLRQGPVWVSAVAQVGFQVTFLAAVPRVGVAVGTLVAVGCTPILTGLIAGHTDRTWLAATSLAVFGLVLLVRGGAEGRVDVLGLLFAFGAAACYAVYISAGRAMTDRRLPMTAAITAVFVLAAAMLCPALLLQNEPEAALETIDQGLSVVSHNSERFFEAELYRLKARALLMRGAPDAEAEALLDQALRTARSQQARSLELRAATDLARLWMKQGKHAAAHDVLSSIYGRFSEGFDTRDLREAKAVIAQLH